MIDGWLKLAAAGEYRALAHDLMLRHYDPRYEKHRARFAENREAVILAESLDDRALDDLAAAAERAVQALI